MNAVNQIREVARSGVGWRFGKADEQFAAKFVIVSLRCVTVFALGNYTEVSGPLMATTTTTAPPGPEDRLDSWKEIAAYLKRGVRTVQRWERSSGLPVHRLEPDRQGSVFAYKPELDTWWESRRQTVPAVEEEVADGSG